MECCDVSVIIPTYNRLPLLKEAVDSVLRQEILPREILVVDDGSEDGTGEWLREVESEQLRVFFRPNRGPGVARNFGVEQARCPYVAFLDSDDLWLPKKLRDQMGFLQENPSYKLCQTEEIWIRRGVRVNPRERHRKFSGYIFEKCLKLCIISPSAVVMEKEFFKKVGGFDPDYPVCEDYELWLRVSLKSPVKTLASAWTVKRGGHPDQLSRKYWGMDRFRVKALEKILQMASLTRSQKEALLEELQFKLRVLENGFAKRHPEKNNPYQQRLTWLKRNLRH